MDDSSAGTITKRPLRVTPREDTERLARREGFASSLRLRRPRDPLGRCAPTRHSLIARDAHRQRSWLAKKNPNPRKINDLRSNDRRIAAYRGTQDGTQHRKPHPGGTEFWLGWMGF